MKNDIPFLTFDGIDYNKEDLSEKSIYICQHLDDIYKKINKSQTELDFLNVAKEAFVNLLGDSLTEDRLDKREEQ